MLFTYCCLHVRSPKHDVKFLVANVYRITKQRGKKKYSPLSLPRNNFCIFPLFFHSIPLAVCMGIQEKLCCKILQARSDTGKNSCGDPINDNCVLQKIHLLTLLKEKCHAENEKRDLRYVSSLE